MARRKSRRRADKKHANRNSGKLTRRITIWLGSIIIIVLLTIIIGYYSIMAWLQSDSCREQVETSLSDKIKAPITITDPLNIDDSSVILNEVIIKDKSIIKDARFGTVKADFVFDELWDKCFHATNVNIKRVDINLDNTEKPPYTIKGGEGKSFLSDLAPDRAVIDKIECEKSNINLTILRSDQDKQPLKYGLSSSEVTALPEKDDSWTFKIRKGMFTSEHPYLRQCSVDRATLHCRPIPAKNDNEEADYLLTLSDCVLFNVKGGADKQKLEGDGRAALNGYFQVSNNKQNRKWEVAFDAENAELNPILDKSWRKYIHGGKLSARIKMNGTYKKIKKVETLKPSAGARPQIILKNAKFHALKYIQGKQPDAIKKITDSLLIPKAADYLEEKLNIIEISEARCTVTYPYKEAAAGIKNGWQISNIDIITKDKDFRVKGMLIIDSDDKFRKSKLELGISSDMIATLASYSPAPELFAQLAKGNLPQKDGYCWIPIPIEGSINSPAVTSFNSLTDALKKQVMEQFASGAETLKDLGSALLNGAQKGKNETATSNIPGRVLETGSDVMNEGLETGTDILNKGIDTIKTFNLIP